MARVTVVGRVSVGGTVLPIKRVEDFAPVLGAAHRHTFEATAVQLRVLAEEARELVVQKLYAGAVGVAVIPPRGPGGSPRRVAGSRTVDQPKVLRRPDIEGEERRPYRHLPLSPRTVAKKVARGHDGRKLIEGGDYTKGIEVVRTKQSASGVAYRVRPAPRRHRPADPNSTAISSRMLARVHEFGSATHKVPARPHWGPAIRIIRRKFEDLPDDVRAEALRAALREIR